MKIQTFIDFNKTFKRHWERWYSDAPRSYRLPVYENATPLSLIILYGQNRTVYKPEQASVDHLFWQKNFDPLVFSRFQLALAVHYLYVSL